MTIPAVMRKADMMRAAEVAKQTGCRMEIRISKSGETVITIIPQEREPDTAAEEYPHLDHSRPEL